MSNIIYENPWLIQKKNAPLSRKERFHVKQSLKKNGWHFLSSHHPYVFPKDPAPEGWFPSVSRASRPSARSTRRRKVGQRVLLDGVLASGSSSPELISLSCCRLNRRSCCRLCREIGPTIAWPSHPTGCGAPRAAFGNQRCVAPGTTQHQPTSTWQLIQQPCR